MSKIIFFLGILVGLTISVSKNTKDSNRKEKRLVLAHSLRALTLHDRRVWGSMVDRKQRDSFKKKPE